MKNLINGQKPEFGNTSQIKELQRIENIFTGKINFHEIEWMPAVYIDGGGKSKPRYKYVDDYKDADCLVDHVPCPRCGKNHILLICLEDSGVWYEDLLAVDKETQEGFECWNCGLSMHADDDRNVYVKVD